MKIKMNKFSIILLIVLITITLSIGCQPEEEPENEGNTDTYDDEDTNDGMDEDMGDDDMTDDTDMDDTDEEMDEGMNGKSEEIANSIVEMEGINDASVVIRDNTAIVAVDAADVTDGEVSEEMKQDIEAKVREMDENISDVYISAETDMFDEINKIAEDIRKGDPIEEFGEDIDDLIDRLTNNTAE